MKVRFLIDGESPEFGPFKKGEERDLAPGVERDLVERGVAELTDKRGYKKGKGGKGNG